MTRKKIYLAILFSFSLKDTYVRGVKVCEFTRNSVDNREQTIHFCSLVQPTTIDDDDWATTTVSPPEASFELDPDFPVWSDCVWIEGEDKGLYVPPMDGYNWEEMTPQQRDMKLNQVRWWGGPDPSV